MEFYGPGVKNLEMADRAMIANMAVDMGLTAAVFPSDEVTRSYLEMNSRPNDWVELPTGENRQFETSRRSISRNWNPWLPVPTAPTT